MQLLDEEVQALADFAALFQQAFDFIQMRLQARDFFRHVDANGKSGGFGQCAVAGCFGQDGAVGKGHGFLPALHEALALLLDQLRHQRHRLLGQRAQLLGAVQHHGGQALAFAFAGGQQRCEGVFGQRRHGFTPVVRAGIGVGAQAQRIGHAQRRSAGQPRLDGVLQGVEALQQARWWVLQGVAVFVFDGGTHLHLATLEAGCEQAAQRGFQRTQVVRKAEGQVQKAAIDRTDFQAQPAILGGAALGFSASGRRALLRAGVSGHAVNWHWTF